MTYRILAIDPGYDRMGLAVVEGTASEPKIIFSECVLPPKGLHETRLAHVALATARAIKKFSPDALAMETLFFSANRKTALGVAEARGTVLAEAGKAGLPVLQYSPQEIKLAVTGNGRADKASVAKMLPHLITLSNKKRLDDELDAIAVGLTALAIGKRH